MDSWMRQNIPYLWREDNPDKHKLGVYGQQHADGWHCWGCEWMNSDASISEKKARIEHGEPKFGEWYN